MKRKKTKSIQTAQVKIGDMSPVSIQSMTTTKTHDVAATVKQIHKLEMAGCEIVRVAVPNSQSADALSEIKKQIHIPLVADIHFDHKLALRSVEAGVDKIRINPGNIGSEEKIAAVLDACNEAKIPIRIGVNGGSLEKDILAQYGKPTVRAIMESAKRHIQICESHHFFDLAVSLKSSDVPTMIEVNRQFSQEYDYPLHLGVTEAGTVNSGSLRSAIGVGTLLSEGIGDTIRISLSGDPVQEVVVARRILQTLGLRSGGVKVVSCPTCGRTSYDVAGIATELENRLESIHKDIRIAVMGCVVNGPGEAREADLGIAGAGENRVMLFERGVKKALLPLDNIVDEIMERVKNLK